MLVKVDGVEYELLMPDQMNMGTQRKFRQIAGVGPDRIGDLLDDYDPGVIVAWMAVSIWHANEQVPLKEIEKRLDELMPAELDEIWENLVTDDEEQAGQSPPASEPEPNAKQPSSLDGSETGSVQTPETSSPSATGILRLPTGATSDPETLAG